MKNILLLIVAFMLLSSNGFGQLISSTYPTGGVKLSKIPDDFLYLLMQQSIKDKEDNAAKQNYEANKPIQEETTFYDQYGNITGSSITITDNFGNKTTTFYDKEGRITKKTTTSTYNNTYSKPTETTTTTTTTYNNYKIKSSFEELLK